MQQGSSRDLLKAIRTSREAVPIPAMAIIYDVLHDITEAEDICKSYEMKLQRYCTREWMQNTSLYDLMVVSTVLHRHGHIGGAELAMIAQRLLKAESQVGGPYKDETDEVSVVANIAAAYFARTVGIALPQVDDFIRREANVAELNPIDAYMLTEALPDVKQEASMPIVAAAFIIAARWRGGRVGAAQSRLLMTELHGEIIKGVDAQLASLRQPLQDVSCEVFQKVQRADKSREIALIPAFFGASLKESADESLYAPLGQANIYSWMAYTVYDDFLDDEGEAKFLSVANMSMRQALLRYRSAMPGNKEFGELLTEVFDAMDEANAWEVEQCRFRVKGDKVIIGSLPRYGDRSQLAKRSSAHILGPLALVAQQWSLSSRQARLVRKGLEQYIIARQLNDDAHDWLDDMKVGQASFVVTHLLRQLRVRPGEYDLESLLVRMKQYFWRHSAARVCDITLHHVKAARSAFAMSGIANLSKDFSSLLTKIERSTLQTHERQASEREFMDAYRNF